MSDNLDTSLDPDHSKRDENASQHFPEDKRAMIDHGQPTTDGTLQRNEQPINNENTNANSPATNSTVEADQQETYNEEQETRNSGTHNSELITKEMEVHHHSHSHGKKNWKNYFWEFLMLFLAVFCGFLAEYYLEHRIEKERAKQYLQSLYEDLKTDTARLKLLIIRDNEKIAAMADMTSCYDTVIKDMKTTSCMGMLVKCSRSNTGFQITDRTLRQLSNAGGFRMLDKEDADSILVYENLFKNYYNFQSTLFQGAQDNIRNTLNQLADFKVNVSLQAVTLQNTDTTSGKLSGPLLFTEDRVLLNKWFNELALYLRATKGQRSQLIVMRDMATRLIEFYKQRHKLE